MLGAFISEPARKKRWASSGTSGVLGHIVGRSLCVLFILAFLRWGRACFFDDCSFFNKSVFEGA